VGGRMKKFLAFVIFYSFLWIIFCPNANAQWEGAQVQRLFYNSSEKKILGLYIDKNDNLFLFYQQWKWDPQVQPYLDTLFVRTKAKGGEWSQPEKIGYPPFDLSGYEKYVGYDVETGLTHIFYVSYPYLGCAETLYYANSTMSGWQPVKIDSLSDEQNAQYGSLFMKFDTLDNVHLIWHVGFDSIGSSWYKVMYANNSPGVWTKQQVSPSLFSGGFRAEGRFTVDKDGTAHILYNEPPWVTDFYTRNDSLNSINWLVDTVPKPSFPFYSYGGLNIIADGNDRVHLFTAGCEDGECMTGYFDFYYYKQSKDSVWIGPDPTYQPDADDLSFSWAFIDGQDHVHVSLIKMGFMIYTHNYFYTTNKQGSWIEPYQILHTEPYWPSEFRFVMDSECQGHGVFIGYEPYIHWDSSGIYYLGPTTGVEDDIDHNKRFIFHLFQNYPNPFNPSTLIEYELKEDCYVSLNIYNLLGQKVRALESGERSKGFHSISWDGEDNNGKEVASGIYLYQLATGDYKQSKRLVLIK
jgi:hypothetical protein